MIINKMRIMSEGLRVVVTGKGGVGKTTVSAMLAILFAMDGYKVLAVDEDPQINLPFSLGIKPEEAEKIIPLGQNLDYIEEKVGTRPGEGWGQIFRLNPDISDVTEKFELKAPNNVNILVMGTVKQAAGGCLCPEHALLKAVINHISLRQNEIVIMDTQAGLEHFGRAIAKGFQYVLVVTDATFNAMQVAKEAIKLSRELSIPNIFVLLNKINNEENIKKVNDFFKDVTIFELPYENKLSLCEPDVGQLFSISAKSAFINSLKKIKELLI